MGSLFLALRALVRRVRSRAKKTARYARGSAWASHETHEVRTLFRNAMLQAVYGLSRPGIMFVRACLLTASSTKGTHFVHFCAKASVLAAGLAVGGVASCFAGNAEGLLRPSRVNGEVDLRTLSRPRAGPPTFAKMLARPRGGFCRPHRSSRYGNVCKNAVSRL